jgi:hypothetical protein
MGSISTLNDYMDEEKDLLVDSDDEIGALAVVDFGRDSDDTYAGLALVTVTYLNEMKMF